MATLALDMVILASPQLPEVAQRNAAQQPAKNARSNDHALVFGPDENKVVVEV